MNNNSRLLKNTLLISVTGISAQIINFLFLPLYTSVLTTEEYGLIDIYTVLCKILSFLMFLGIEQSLFLFGVSVQDKKEKKEYFSTGIGIASISLIVFSSGYLLLSIIFHFSYTALAYFYFISCGLFFLLSNFSRGLENVKVYSSAMALGTVLNVFFNILFVVGLRVGVKGVLLGTSIAYMLANTYVVISLSLWNVITIKVSATKAKEMLRYSLPLVLNNLMGWIATSSDRFIISALLGTSANGIYSLACKFYSILSVLTNGFTMAWAEQAVKVVNKPWHKEYYRKILVLAMDVYFLIISGIVIALPFVFERLFNSAYHDAYYHIPIIIYASYFYTLSAITAHMLLAHKHSKEIGTSTLLVAVINLAVHFLLIGKIGLYAATISTLVSYIALFVFRYIKMYKVEKIKFPMKKTIVQLCIYSGFCLCYYSKEIWRMIAAALIYVLFLTFYTIKYREELSGLIKKISLIKKAGAI